MNPLRTQSIDRATNEVQDCLVIGAGINGAVAAAALAGKGARVTVIDRSDFASATSQQSSNLAWGGIKYLENYEFPLVRNLCKSRNHLMDAYPSQIQEIRFYTCIAKGFRKPHILIYFGALLYWAMGNCRTRAPRLLSAATIRKEAPEVDTAPLSGGLEYSDAYFVENDARFAFGFIRKVLQKKGCNAINYMELLAAEWNNGMWRCSLRDHCSETTYSLHTRTLVNATGPGTDKINAMLRIDSPFKHIFSKGAHIVVPKITKTRHVLTFFASDGRLFFMIPMGNRTCIGTTDTRVDHEVAEPTTDDVDFLLSNANALLHLEKPLVRADVIAQRCGVRPLVVKKEANIGNVEWTALSRKHEIDIHPERNLCTIYGGKLTDCINIGEEIAETIESFGVHMFQSLECWFGEPGADKRARFEAQARALKLPEEQISRLWRRYGKEAFQCLEKIRRDPAMAQPVLEKFIRAELHQMAEREMVVHLEDFLRRRTKLELTHHRASLHCDLGLKETAQILFGKNAETEIERYFA